MAFQMPTVTEDGFRVQVARYIAMNTASNQEAQPNSADGRINSLKPGRWLSTFAAIIPEIWRRCFTLLFRELEPNTTATPRGAPFELDRYFRSCCMKLKLSCKREDNKIRCNNSPTVLIAQSLGTLQKCFVALAEETRILHALIQFRLEKLEDMNHLKDLVSSMELHLERLRIMAGEKRETEVKLLEDRIKQEKAAVKSAEMYTTVARKLEEDIVQFNTVADHAKCAAREMCWFVKEEVYNVERALG